MLLSSLTLIFVYSLSKSPSASLSDTDPPALLKSKNLIEISKISIHDDSVFSLYCSLGDGSEFNPYIIENYNITLSFSGMGIEISRTTKHFIIRNCLIQNALVGIKIHNIANGTALVFNNTFIKSQIIISYTRHAELRNNSFLGLGCYLSISFSNSISIINNTFVNSGSNAAIKCIFSYNLIIMGNTIRNTIGLGIYLDLSYYAVISHNSIINSTSWCIEISSSHPEIVFHHNNLINNSEEYGSQARSWSSYTTWYDTNKDEGNYWSDWSGTGSYYINESLVDDLYPFESEIIFNWTNIIIPDFYEINDDQYEHNDLFIHAKPLQINQVYQLNAYDDDYFRISLSIWFQLKMTISYNRNDVLIDMSLLDEDGEIIEIAHSAEHDYVIEHFSMKTEDYIIKIAPRRNFLPSPEYTLNISAFTEFGDDSFEENDIMGDARTIDSDNAIYNLIYADVDIFRVSVDIGFTIQVDLSTENQFTDLDLFLVLYNETDEDITILAEGSTEISNESITYRTSKTIVCYLIIQCGTNNGIPLFPFEYTIEINTYLISKGFPISSSFIFLIILLCSAIFRICNKKHWLSKL